MTYQEAKAKQHEAFQALEVARQAVRDAYQVYFAACEVTSAEFEKENEGFLHRLPKMSLVSTECLATLSH